MTKAPEKCPQCGAMQNTEIVSVVYYKCGSMFDTNSPLGTFPWDHDDVGCREFVLRRIAAIVKADINNPKSVEDAVRRAIDRGLQRC